VLAVTLRCSPAQLLELEPAMLATLVDELVQSSRKARR
jgi:hypothetical protein